MGFSIRGGGGRQRGPKNPTKPTIKMPLEERYNFSHCKIEIDLSCSDSYTLEPSLLALKAANSSASCLKMLVKSGQKGNPKKQKN